MTDLSNSVLIWVLDHKVLVGTASAAILGLLYLWQASRKDRHLKLPPGPRCLPIVGALGYSALDPDLYMKLMDQYGDIVYWHYFGQRMVILGTHQAMREAMLLTRAAGEPLSGRMQNFFRRIFNLGSGIANAEGEMWRVHRRFALHILRDLGFGRSIAEQIIREEAEWLLQLIADPNLAHGQNSSTDDQQVARQVSSGGTGEPIVLDPQMVMVRAINNVVSRLLFAENCSDDPRFENVVNTITSIFRNSPGLARMPIAMLLRLPVLLPSLIKVIYAFTKVRKFIESKIEAHKRSLAPDVRPEQTSSLIDAYIAEMRQQDATVGRGKHTFTDPQISQVALEFFIAGTETTVNTLRWALLHVAKRPEIQKLVREEIASVVGDREPLYGDRVRMPYTEAVLCEVHRFSSLIVFAGRRVIEPCKIRGYDLPTDTVVFPVLLAVHRDPKLWPVPDRFAPQENFLSKSGSETGTGSGSLSEANGTATMANGEACETGEKESDSSSSSALVRSEFLVPFGMGKRECLGETLARTELFIFFVRILQKYEVRPPPEGPEALSEEPAMKTFRFAKPFKLTFVPV